MSGGITASLTTLLAESVSQKGNEVNTHTHTINAHGFI